MKMKRKSKIPDGYSSMKERAEGREKHKSFKLTMVWKQSRINSFKNHNRKRYDVL